MVQKSKKPPVTRIDAPVPPKRRGRPRHHLAVDDEGTICDDADRERDARTRRQDRRPGFAPVRAGVGDGDRGAGDCFDVRARRLSATGDWGGQRDGRGMGGATEVLATNKHGEETYKASSD